MLLALLYQLVRYLTDLVLVSTQSDAQLRAEVLALRHQLRVLERKVGKPAWQPGDRLLLAALSRLLRRSSLDALLPRPETLLRWHRELVCMEVAVGGRSLTARSSPVGDPFAPDEFAVPAQQGVGVGQERSPVRPGQDATDRSQVEAIAGLPAWPADLALKYPELVTEGQDLSFKPGLGPAADDQDFQHETSQGVEQGVEHDRGSIAQASRSSAGSWACTIRRPSVHHAMAELLDVPFVAHERRAHVPGSRRVNAYELA